MFYNIENRIKELEAEVASLKAIIVELLAEIDFLRNGRKSKTSHTPPSQDIGRSNQKSYEKKAISHKEVRKGMKVIHS